jgi:DUF971 family protein
VTLSRSTDAVRPVKIHLERGAHLQINWADGRESVYPLAYLRKQCPCATCRTERESGVGSTAEPTAEPSGGGGAGRGGVVARKAGDGVSLSILPQGFDRRAAAQSAALVGNYALQIRWADGHDTGIYDFGYLRTIDPAASAESSE